MIESLERASWVGIDIGVGSSEREEPRRKQVDAPLVDILALAADFEGFETRNLFKSQKSEFTRILIRKKESPGENRRGRRWF